MQVQLQGYARLTPRRDPEAMSNEFLWIAANRAEARQQALRGREYIVREWNRKKAFADLSTVFKDTARDGRGVAQEMA